MEKVLEKICLSAAENEGASLKELLCEAWSIMSVAQKRRLLKSTATSTLVGKDFAECLLSEFQEELAKIKTTVLEAGYVFKEHGNGFYWEVGTEENEENEEMSEDYFEFADALVSAFEHLQSKEKQ